MTKKIDTNGYWYIKKNPISKEGVFPYLGHNISDECEPNKIYKVYRPASTLKDSVETWDNPPKPFIDDHEMLGEGFTAIDDRPVQGIIYNPVFDDGVLYADIAVYSEDLKSNIENGKKELSLGYFCKYKKERGVFNGEVYDYVQYDMVGNHIALVDAGRCGSDVKVFDHKCTMDSLALSGFEESPLKKASEDGIIESKETKGSNMSYVAIDDVRGVLAGVFDAADPKLKSIMDELEEKAKTEDEDEKEEEKKSEDSDEEKEEKKSEDKCGKDEDDDEKKESEDEDDDEKKETADSIKELMSVVKDMALDIKKLVAKDEDDEEKKESEDGDDSEKESEDEDDDEKKSEDEDEEETKKSEDSAVFVFGQDSAIAEDEGLKEYLK